MVAITCVNCGKEFKLSGADFTERHRDGIPDLCPVCAIKKSMEKFQVEEPEEIEVIEEIEEPLEPKKSEK